MKGLRAARERAGLSQERLAALSGVTSTTIRRAETGVHSPLLANGEKIAAALGVPLEQLLRDPEPAATVGAAE